MKWFSELILILFWTAPHEAHSYNEELVEIYEEDYIRKAFFNSIQELLDKPNLCKMQLSYMSENYKKLNIFPSESLNKKS